MIIRADSYKPFPLADGSVNCCVCSPPYWGLRDYGIPGQLGMESTPDEYVSKMVMVFREVRRVLRDDGTLWINLGDSYASSTKGSGGSSEKQLSNAGSFYSESQRWEHGCKPKDLVGIPWMVAFALRADGWYLRSDIIWSKPNPMPESVTDRPTKSHEYLFLLSKSARYRCDAEAVREPQSEDSIAAYERARANPREPVDWKQNRAIAHIGVSPTASPNAAWSDAEKLERLLSRGRNLRSVWTIATRPYSEAHFATFPPELASRCIKAGCPTGGIVLDPFAGAGTTGLAALALGRRFIGLELSPEYTRMARLRLDTERWQPESGAIVRVDPDQIALF